MVLVLARRGRRGPRVPSTPVEVPDPKLRQQVEDELEAADPDARPAKLLERFEPLLKACPGIERAMMEVAREAEEHRCTTLHIVLETELPDCPRSLDRDQLDTYVLLLAGARSDGLEAVAFPVVFDSDAPVPTPPAGTWEAWAGGWFTDASLRRVGVPS